MQGIEEYTTPRLRAFKVDSFKLLSDGVKIISSDKSSVFAGVHVLSQGLKVGDWCIVREGETDNDEADIEMIDEHTFHKRYKLKIKEHLLSTSSTAHIKPRTPAQPQTLRE